MSGRLERAIGDEAGLTLIELLVATTMAVVIVGATGSMLIGAVRSQPDVSERAFNVGQARWALERMTREIRNGLRVEEGSDGSQVTFIGRVRRETCGGTTMLASDEPAIECAITYDCSSGEECVRAEAPADEPESGSSRTFFSGIDSADVFSYSPDVADARYVGVTLRIRNPSGPGLLTISDGASLRTLNMLYAG